MPKEEYNSLIDDIEDRDTLIDILKEKNELYIRRIENDSIKAESYKRELVGKDTTIKYVKVVAKQQETRAIEAEEKLSFSQKVANTFKFISGTLAGLFVGTTLMK